MGRGKKETSTTNVTALIDDEKKVEQFWKNLNQFGVSQVVPRMADVQKRILDAIKGTGKSGAMTLKVIYNSDLSEGDIEDENSTFDLKFEVSGTVSEKFTAKGLPEMKMHADRNSMLMDYDPDQMTIDETEGDRESA
jgi:hypothetical protein